MKGNALNNQANKSLVFKNNTSFISCISKVNNTFVNNAEDINLIMPMYNLLEYSDNYYMTSGKLWNYYRDDVNDDQNENNDSSNYGIDNNITTNKSFYYKTKITEEKTAITSRSDKKVVAPLKYLTNFWKILDLPFINCGIELDLPWSKIL